MGSIQQIKDLLSKKDNTIQSLQNQLEESENMVRQLEQQGRDNEEKVMSELAVKIRAAEGFQLKLEECKQLLEDRNKTIEGLMDRLDAQKRLIDSRDQVIDQLKAMKNLDSGADELVSTLREQLEAMSSKLEQSVDETEKAKNEVRVLKKELEEKSELIASAEKVKCNILDTDNDIVACEKALLQTSTYTECAYVCKLGCKALGWLLYVHIKFVYDVSKIFSLN